MLSFFLLLLLPTSNSSIYIYLFKLLLRGGKPSETTQILLQTMNSSPTKFPPTNRLSSHRSQSFSSLSSCSSSIESSFSCDSPMGPSTPAQFSGIPFSWEKIPGIPKKQASRKKDETPLSLLPLPPSTALAVSKRFSHPEETGIRRKNISESFRRDPFFAAFVECCKDEGNDGEERFGSLWKSSKGPRNLSDRLGFINLYTSCKRTCAVSESIILLPRSARSSYDPLHRRSR